MEKYGKIWKNESSRLKTPLKNTFIIALLGRFLFVVDVQWVEKLSCLATSFLLISPSPFSLRPYTGGIYAIYGPNLDLIFFFLLQFSDLGKGSNFCRHRFLATSIIYQNWAYRFVYKQNEMK